MTSPPQSLLSDAHLDEFLGRVLDGLGDCLAGHFDIEHSTFQLEQPEHRGHEGATHR